MSMVADIIRTMRVARATLRTRLVRRLRHQPNVEAALRVRIAKRIRNLGRTYQDGNSDLAGVTYHPIYFSGFEEVMSHRQGCEARLRAITDDLHVRPGDWILDVGANVGYFTFGLAELGARVEAYEAESDSFEIGAALARLYDRDVLFINKLMSLRALDLVREHYRAVLLLSVFHWIVKQEGEEDGVRVLQDLSRRADHLYFEVPCASADAQYKHRWFSTNDSVREFLRFALPGHEATPIWTDPSWMNRILWRITPASR